MERDLKEREQGLASGHHEYVVHETTGQIKIFLYELLGTMFITATVVFAAVGAYGQSGSFAVGVPGNKKTFPIQYATGVSSETYNWEAVAMKAAGYENGPYEFLWINLMVVGAFFLAYNIAFRISGGHFNPAVTLAVFIGRNTNGKGKFCMLLGLYWLPQFIGGVLGFILPRLLINDWIKKTPSGGLTWTRFYYPFADMSRANLLKIVGGQASIDPTVSNVGFWTTKAAAGNMALWNRNNNPIASIMGENIWNYFFYGQAKKPVAATKLEWGKFLTTDPKELLYNCGTVRSYSSGKTFSDPTVLPINPMNTAGFGTVYVHRGGSSLLGKIPFTASLDNVAYDMRLANTPIATLQTQVPKGMTAVADIQKKWIDPWYSSLSSGSTTLSGLTKAMVDEVGNARAAPFNQQICSLLRTATPVWNDSEVLSTWFGINFTLYDADLPAGICGLLSSLYSTTWSAVTADIKSNVRFTGVTPLAVLFKCIKLFNGGTIGNKMTYTALNTAQNFVYMDPFNKIMVGQLNGSPPDTDEIKQLVVEMEGYGGIFMYPWAESDFSAFLVEFWATFILCITFLIATHHKTAHSKDAVVNGVGIAVGFSVAIGIAYQACGGSYLNPAIGFGLNLMSRLFYSTPFIFGKVWIYIFGPLLGAIFAGIMYGYWQRPAAEYVVSRSHHIHVVEHHVPTHHVVEHHVPTHHVTTSHHVPTTHHTDVVTVARHESPVIHHASPHY